MTQRSSVSSISRTKPNFVNPGIYDLAGKLLAFSGAASPVQHGYSYKFAFANPIVVPRGGSFTLLLKGDVASAASGAAIDYSSHEFTLEGKNIIAVGADTTATIDVSGSATASAVMINRSKLTVRNARRRRQNPLHVQVFGLIFVHKRIA